MVATTETRPTTSTKPPSIFVIPLLKHDVWVTMGPAKSYRNFLAYHVCFPNMMFLELLTQVLDFHLAHCCIGLEETTNSTRSSPEHASPSATALCSKGQRLEGLLHQCPPSQRSQMSRAAPHHHSAPETAWILARDEGKAIQ